MIFKVNQKSFDKMSKELINDVAEHVIVETKAQLKKIDPLYGWVGDSFEFDGQHTVGSEEWAAAGLNHGMEFKWGNEMPNVDNIMNWIKNTKDPYKFGTEDILNPSPAFKRVAWAVIMQIKNHGLQNDMGEYGMKHHWYFDSAIQFVDQVSYL